MTVHHIVPRARGGTEDPKNLLTLCPPCHDQAEQLADETAPEPVSWDALTRPPAARQRAYRQRRTRLAPGAGAR